RDIVAARGACDWLEVFVKRQQRLEHALNDGGLCIEAAPIRVDVVGLALKGVDRDLLSARRLLVALRLRRLRRLSARGGGSGLGARRTLATRLRGRVGGRRRATTRGRARGGRGGPAARTGGRHGHVAGRVATAATGRLAR